MTIWHLLMIGAVILVAITVIAGMQPVELKTSSEETEETEETEEIKKESWKGSKRTKRMYFFGDSN